VPEVNRLAFGDLRDEFPATVVEEFPSFIPFIPSRDSRFVELDAPNPFTNDKDASGIVHPRFREPSAIAVPREKAEVNAFIKACFSTHKENRKEKEKEKPLDSCWPYRDLPKTRVTRRDTPKDTIDPRLLTGLTSVPASRLPPHFGDVTFQCPLDRELYRFCRFSFQNLPYL
jgi:hypothetical protein